MASPAVLEFERRIPEEQKGQWNALTDAQKEARVERVQQQLFKEYAEAGNEADKIAVLEKRGVPEAERANLRQNLDAEIARQKAGAASVPTKPADSSFHNSSRIQMREPEVAVRLEYFTEPTENQAIVSALLLWALFGSTEQKNAATIILGDVNAETLKGKEKCEALVKEFNRKKFDEQKLKPKILQTNTKFYAVVSEKWVVDANEVKENLLKYQALPVEISVHVSFKTLTEKTHQDNFLKSLRTQFLLEGKTARDENVKSAEFVKEELVVEFKDEAKLRLKFNENGSIQATYQAKEADLKTKDAVLVAFTHMAKKFYATFLEAELASNKDACPESFDITISLKSSDLSGAEATDIAKQFHENGFAKVCVKIDEAAQIFETKEPKSFAPPKTESPIAQYEKAQQLKASLEQASKAETTLPENKSALIRHLANLAEVTRDPLELPPILSVLPYPMVTEGVKAARDWLFPRPDFTKVRELARAKILSPEQVQEFATELTKAQQNIDGQYRYAADLLRATALVPASALAGFVMGNPITASLSGVKWAAWGLGTAVSYLPGGAMLLSELNLDGGGSMSTLGSYANSILSWPPLAQIALVSTVFSMVTPHIEKLVGKKSTAVGDWEQRFFKLAPSMAAAYLAGSSWLLMGSLFGLAFELGAAKAELPGRYYSAKEQFRSYKIGPWVIGGCEFLPRVTAWVGAAQQGLFKRIMPDMNPQEALGKPLTKP